MNLSDNIWWTRKAKIQAEKRLLNNIFQTQLLLLWYSFWGVAVSIYHLQAESSEQLESITWVVFSVLILCISGFINGLSFKERATLIKECYETLHGLLQQSMGKTGAELEEVEKEYRLVLNVCENHIDYDYFWAICIEFWTHPNPKGKNSGLTKLPTRYIWTYAISHMLMRVFLFSVLYAIPVLMIVMLGFRFC